MKPIVAASLIAAFLVAIAACQRPAGDPPAPAAQAQYQSGDSLTITGTLVDSRCFALDKEQNKHMDHNRPAPEGFVNGCARACALAGYPVGVLKGGETDGDFWILVTVPQALADYMAQTVRVTGTVRSNGVLLPDHVALKEGDNWTYIL